MGSLNNYSRILIVDDSDADRHLLRMCLEKFGNNNLHIDEVESASSALSVLEDQSYDAIFLDIRMPPGNDGFYVLDQLREKQKATWPLIFMWSSSDHPEDVAKSYHGLATAFYQKPTGLSDLRNLAESLLGMIGAHARPALAT